MRLAVIELQREAAFLYTCGWEEHCPADLLWLRISYQQRAAAISFAARVLAGIESALP